MFPLFLLGGLYSLLSCRFLSGNCYTPGFESEAIARSLAATGNFADPYQTVSTGLTAHLPPLYPAFLAILLHFCRSLPPVAFFLYLNLATAIMFGLFAAVLPSLAKQRVSGRLAALMIVLLPVIKIQIGWEGVPLSLLLVLFCLVSMSSRPRSWLQGMIAACVILLNAPALLFIAVWSLGMLVSKRWSARILVNSSLICFLFCSPWLIRNYIALGSFCVRDNFGLGLQVSNNDLAHPLLMDNVNSGDLLFHPNMSTLEALRLKDLGEVEYNKRKLHEAISWIQVHPGRFAELSFQRFVFFWFPDRRETPFAIPIWILTIAAIPAMLLSLRNLDMSAILLASLLAFSLPYMLVQADLRYRTPVIWVTVLFASESLVLAIAGVKTRLSHRQALPSTVVA